MHNALEVNLKCGQRSQRMISPFLYGSVVKSFLYTKICFIVSKNAIITELQLEKVTHVAMVAEVTACKNIASYLIL